jgi:hypothetical protein
MKGFFRFLVLVLLISFILMTGCVTGPGYGTPTPTVTPDLGSCTNDSQCVPAQCCHPTSCINAAYKEVCTELCTLECKGPIDCGAGHCACVDGTCKVIPGPET